MENENKFWFSLFTMIACTLLLFGVIGTYSSHLEDAKLVEMVDNGADPIRAKCAIMSSESSRSNTMCVSLVNAK